MFSRWAKLISIPEGWSMGAVSSANLRANWYTNDVPPPQLISHISPGVNIHPGDLQLSGCHGHRLFMGRGAPANAKMHGLRQVFACAGYFHSNICMPSLVDVALRLCIRHLAWSSVFGRLHLDHYSVFVLFIVDVPWHLNMRHKQKKLCRQYAQVMLRSPKRDTSYSKRDEGTNTWSHNRHSIHVHTQIWANAFVLKQVYETETPSFCERTMAYKVWYGKSSPNELSSMKSGHRISSLLALLHPLCAPPFQYAAGVAISAGCFCGNLCGCCFK